MRLFTNSVCNACGQRVANVIELGPPTGGCVGACLDCLFLARAKLALAVGHGWLEKRTNLQNHWLEGTCEDGYVLTDDKGTVGERPVDIGLQDLLDFGGDFPMYGGRETTLGEWEIIVRFKPAPPQPPKVCGYSPCEGVTCALLKGHVGIHREDGVQPN